MQQTTMLEYLKNFKDEVTNMHNLFCSNCNECCSLHTPMTKEEYITLQEYFQTADGKKILQQARNKVKRYIRKNTLYEMCPFTDDETKKCRIYDLRPTICKNFHCSKPKEVESLKIELMDREDTKLIYDFFKDILEPYFGGM